MQQYHKQIRAHSASFDPDLPSEDFSSQWRHPRDVFSVLLLLGGDVVLRALGQISGTWFTPVTFSFGASDDLTFRLKTRY